MISVQDKRKCSGCEACANACPTSAIRFALDEKGFSYPEVDASKCVNCGKCERACPHHGERQTGAQKMLSSQMEARDPAILSQVEAYYRALGKKALLSNNPVSLFARTLFARRDTILISSFRPARLVARLKGMPRMRLGDVEKKVQRFFAMRDAFLLLAKRGISVFYYNRVGPLEQNDAYSPSERRRMEQGLSFPKMRDDIPAYEQDLREIFGELYSREYVAQTGNIPQVVRVGDIYQHEDCASEWVNVRNGKRITRNQPQSFSRTMHVYGRCGAFGYVVEDRDTIPSLLQEQLIRRGIDDIRVVNHGIWGGKDAYLDHNFLAEAREMKPGDIVLFYRKCCDKRLLQHFIDRGVHYKDITDEWHARKGSKVTFFDRPGHMNAEGYKLVAQILCEDLIAHGFSAGKVADSVEDARGADLDRYLRANMNVEFRDEIARYIEGIEREHPLGDDMRENGAIVMNCNPFTKGHRYLVETAAKQVDRLYIFVVEEDRSFFPFRERFEMVKRGTRDIANAVVVPSGKFVISAYTFPAYFMKDYVKSKDFDVSLDVETFCRYIAPPLRIKMRFAGEEPFDPVTEYYNESMAQILPEHGLRFVEIPRLRLDSDRIVSATRVRELMLEGNDAELKQYVPESTYQMLMERGERG